MIRRNEPALILAPMEGITDAPMRALQGEIGAFDFAVSEFVRVSDMALPSKVFFRAIPEVASGNRTPTGLPVQIQILGGDPERMAQSAVAACQAGANAIDLNFGCPAKTVNRNDGGASILRTPRRVRDIVSAVRDALPKEIPVSAKLRLGWDSVESVYETATMAAEGGADWLAIHARTRTQGYNPPVFWKPIGEVRRALGLPVIANGDIWSLEAFRRCQDETGCIHFMFGRSALARPGLSLEIAQEMGKPCPIGVDTEWVKILRRLVEWMGFYGQTSSTGATRRLKQWLKFADLHGDFAHFESVKRTDTLEEFFAALDGALSAQMNRSA